MTLRFSFIFLAFIFVSLVSGCQASRAVYALMHSTDHLIPLPSDPRIRYEPSAEALAQKVAAILPGAIHHVEEVQYLGFKEPVAVYIYATTDSFSAHSGAPSQARGANFHGVVHLSPLLNERIETLAFILTHELSHLHLQQFGGSLGLAIDAPPWFHEGLAVMVSNGGGAEKVTEAEAIKAITSGKHFEPDLSGSILTYKGATYYGLENHMFYRQAALFVSYLHQSDPEMFKSLFLALTNRKPFKEAFSQAYQQPISQVWQSFVASLRLNIMFEREGSFGVYEFDFRILMR